MGGDLPDAFDIWPAHVKPDQEFAPHIRNWLYGVMHQEFPERYDANGDFQAGYNNSKHQQRSYITRDIKNKLRII